MVARLAAENSSDTRRTCGSDGPTHVHHQDDADVGTARRLGDHLELACILGGRVDGALDVELLFDTLAHEALQLAERHHDLAHVEHHVTTIGPVAARIRDADGAAPSAHGAHAEAAGVVATAAERAGASGSDPAVAAFVALALLAQALFEQLTQRIHVHALEQGALLGGQILEFFRIGEPRLDLARDHEARLLDAAKVRGEGLVERIELGLAVHQERARHVIKAVEAAVVDTGRQRPGQCLELGRAHTQLAAAQLVEEGNQDFAHRASPAPQRASPPVTITSS